MIPSMKAIISCRQCAGTDKAVRGEVEAATLIELGPLLTALVVAFHATPPHCPHPMEIEFVPEPPAEVDFAVRCLDPRCHSPTIKELRTRCHREMIGALTLMFHTSHEGHPIEIECDGRSWRSPVA
jgi:hypothetical protein